MDTNGKILQQSSCKLLLNDTVDKAEELLQQLGFKKLFVIEDYSTIWNSDKMSIASKEVKDQGLYIEYEASNGETDEDLINNFRKLNLDIDESDFYIKKAYVALNKLKSVQ